MSKTTNKYSPEVRERAVRMVMSNESQHEGRWSATCGGDAFHLTNRAARREIERLKGEIQQIERLKGSIVVVCGSAVVTVHHGEKSADRPQRGKKEFRYEH